MFCHFPSNQQKRPVLPLPSWSLPRGRPCDVKPRTWWFSLRWIYFHHQGSCTNAPPRCFWPKSLSDRWRCFPGSVSDYIQSKEYFWQRSYWRFFRSDSLIVDGGAGGKRATKTMAFEWWDDAMAFEQWATAMDRAMACDGNIVSKNDAVAMEWIRAARHSLDCGLCTSTYQDTPWNDVMPDNGCQRKKGRNSCSDLGWRWKVPWWRRGAIRGTCCYYVYLFLHSDVLRHHADWCERRCEGEECIYFSTI